MPPHTSGSATGPTADDSAPRASLVPALGLFHATMLVMGGIVGAGIFINPYVVARQVHTPALILGAWVFGGVIALVGAFVYAELAARRPQVGGQYAYFREAYHPAVAFAYGWGLLLVIQTGGMAAVAITFAKYFRELAHLQIADGWLATAALSVLTVINCLGVRAGGTVQSALMVMKIVIVSALVLCGWLLISNPHPLGGAIADRPVSFDLFASFGAAMIPVAFAYGGWQTSNFIASEIREPAKNLPRALVLGVSGVVVLYLSVSLICVRALGAAGLAATTTPASAVMRAALGDRGAVWIAAGIAISALGFLSQGMLTAPRVYFAMARDGAFFKRIAWVDPRTRVPTVAIVVQGIWAIVIALSGKYEQILNFFICMDFLFIGLGATCLFVFRRSEARSSAAPLRHSLTPGHPWSTIFFVASCWIIVASTFYKYPGNSLIGLAIVAAGVPVYFIWGARPTPEENR